MMKTTVKQRILEFIEYKKISVREFERRANLSYGYLKSLRKSPTIDKMQSIIHAFPELNQEWLQTGEGMMINSVAQTVANIHGGGANEPEPRQSVIDQSSVINALIASNSAALDAKNETIAALGRELAAKDSVVALLRQQLSSLQSQVADLRAQLSAIRSAPATLLDYPFPIGTADDLKKTPSTPLK